ncbi:hypothetical protein JW835_00870 [bacterium]|nr:hypothetical protein [bacterium]
MKRSIYYLLIISVLMFAACAAGSNDMADSVNQAGKIAGFWKGLWHGFIVLFTFVISLFSDKVNVYEVHNNGGWYNFGFILGVMTFFGGSSGKAGQNMCRKKKEE